MYNIRGEKRSCCSRVCAGKERYSESATASVRSHNRHRQTYTHTQTARARERETDRLEGERCLCSLSLGVWKKTRRTTDPSNIYTQNRPRLEREKRVHPINTQQDREQMLWHFGRSLLKRDQFSALVAFHRERHQAGHFKRVIRLFYALPRNEGGHRSR